MAVYTGILKTLSGGTQQLSTDRSDNAFIRHEFIQIGDQRLKSVRMLTYHNALLEEAIGKEVSLSLYKGKVAGSSQYILMAMRLPDGTVERIDRGTLLGPTIVRGFQNAFAAAILIGIGLAIGAVAHAPIATIAFVLLAAWLMLSWFRTWTGIAGARGAL